MGLLDTILGRKSIELSPDVQAALDERTVSFATYLATPPGVTSRVGATVVQVQSATYGWLYRNTPAVRTVVDYIARNVAQLALRLYVRKDDIEREQDYDNLAAQAVRYPNETTPGEQFIFSMVVEWLVYNNAYALKMRRGPDQPIWLYWLPTSKVGILGENFLQPEGYRVWNSFGQFNDFKVGDIVHWRGHDPFDTREGFSPLETLRKTLVEDAASQTANTELMKAGYAPPGYLSRPVEAPPIDDRRAVERISEDWRSAMAKPGRHVPVLEEGMRFEGFGITPKDAQQLEGRRFTIATVADIYGIAWPQEGGEARTQFYTDVLPPITEMFASYLDLHILGAEYNDTKRYFEFDLDEKLQGDERLKALVSASGAPVLTRNESRTKLNLPPKEGGDELVTPQNVTVGGKPSPAVMPVQDPNAPPQDGSARGDGIIPAGANEATQKASLSATPAPAHDAPARPREDVMDEWIEAVGVSPNGSELDAKLEKALAAEVAEAPVEPAPQPDEPAPVEPEQPGSGDEDAADQEPERKEKAARNVGPEARRRLEGLIQYYLKKPHPFTACVRDNTKRFGEEGAKRVCATLKDIGLGTTHWRKSEGDPDWCQMLYEAADGNMDALMDMWAEHQTRNGDDVEPIHKGQRVAGDYEGTSFTGLVTYCERDETKPGLNDVIVKLDGAVTLAGAERLALHLILDPEGNQRGPEGKVFRSLRPQPLGESHDKRLVVTTTPRVLADMRRQTLYIDKAKALFERFYRRQSRTMKSKSLKRADTERWNADLAERLIVLITSIIRQEAGIYMGRLNGPHFDMEQVVNYVKQMALGTAEGVNGATQADISDNGQRAAFDRALNLRAETAGTSIGARATLFARQEAAKQAPTPDRRVQIWVADTERHAELDGTAVPLGERWHHSREGDITPGSQPNCACTAMIE